MSNPFEKYLQATERQNANYAYLAEGAPQLRATNVNEIPDDSETNTQKSGGDYLNDFAVATGKTIIGTPQALVGLADIAGYGYENVKQGYQELGALAGLNARPEELQYTGHLGKALEDLGIGFKESQDFLSSKYSEGYQAQQAGLHETEGLLNKAGYVWDNPALAGNTINESIGYMLAGGALSNLAKGALTAHVAATTAGTLTARSLTGAALAAAEKGITSSIGKRVALGALGEAEISAGILQENTRNQTEGGLTSPEQTQLAGAGGAVVGALGYLGGRLSHRAGAADLETAMVSSTDPIRAAYLKNIPIVRMAKGGLIEGLIEEVPQENVENAIENLATNKGDGDVFKGWEDSTVLGFAAGAGTSTTLNAPQGLFDTVKDISSGLGKVKGAVSDAANLKSFDTLSNPEHKNYNPAQAFNLQLKNLESNDETVRTQAEASVSKLETDLNTARASVEERIKSIQATLKAMPPSDQTTDAQKLEIEALGKEYSELTTKSSTLADQYVAFLEAQVTAQEHRDVQQGTQFTEEQAKADIATLTQPQTSTVMTVGDTQIPVQVEGEAKVLADGIEKVIVNYTDAEGNVKKEVVPTSSLASVESTDTTAQQEALDRVTRHFSKYSNDDLDLLATSPILSEAQRNSLRLMSESKRQLAAVQDPSQVFDNILNGYKGKTIRESHRGLNQYTDMVNTAVATKKEQLAQLALDGLGAFTDDHTAKRDVINEAFGLVQNGTYKEIRVVRTQDGTWGMVPFTAQEVRAGKNADGVAFLEGKALKEAMNKVGGFNVHINSNTEGAITQINDETQLIQDRFNALSGVAESFVGATPKPVDTSTSPAGDTPSTIEPLNDSDTEVRNKILSEYPIAELVYGGRTKTQQDAIKAQDLGAMKKAYNLLKAEKQIKLLEANNKKIEAELAVKRELLRNTRETKVGDIVTIINDEEGGSEYKARILQITKYETSALLKIKVKSGKEYSITVDQYGDTRTGYIENFVFEAKAPETRSQLLEDINNLKAQIQEVKDTSDYYVDYFKEGSNTPIVTEPSDTTAPVVTPVPEAPIANKREVYLGLKTRKQELIDLADVNKQSVSESEYADEWQALEALTSPILSDENILDRSDLIVKLVIQRNDPSITQFANEILKEAHARVTKDQEKKAATGQHTSFRKVDDPKRAAHQGKLDESRIFAEEAMKKGLQSIAQLEGLLQGKSVTGTPEAPVQSDVASTPETPTPSQDTPDVTEGDKQAPTQTTENTGKDTTEVGFKLTPTGQYTPKDQLKADKATKFIGEGAANSSTAQYAKDAGDKANTGKYTKNDVVFISVNGARANRKSPNLVEIQKAIDAGATILTDKLSDRERSFNVGEREVAAHLTKNGYVEEGATGVWKPEAKTAEATPSVVSGIKTEGNNTLITSAVSGLTHSVPTKLVNGIFEASYIVKELMAITSKALTPAQREYLEGLLQVFLALDGTILVGLYADLSLIQNDTIRETLQKSKGKAVDYLDEGKRIYIDLNNVEPVDLFEILVHEYHHTVTMQGLKKVEGVGKSSPQYVRLNAAYKAVKAFTDSNPTVDARVLRRLEYMLKNLREFLTVGMVEPTVIEALKGISVSEGKSVYDEISAVNAEILKAQNPKTFPTQQGKLNDLVSTTRGNSSGVQTSSSNSINTPQVESLDTTGNDTKTGNTLRPVATIDGEQTGRGTSEATQSAETSTESQVEPVATEEVTPLKSDFKGKVILAHAGTGKSFATKSNPDLIDGDVLYYQATNTIVDKYNEANNESVPNIENVTGTRGVFEAWGEYDKSNPERQAEAVRRRDEVYAEYAKQARALADAGKTVLSSSIREDLIAVADMVVIQDDAAFIGKNLTSAERVNQNSETDLVKIQGKIDKAKNAASKNPKLESITLGKGEYISDLIFENEAVAPKDAKVTVLQGVTDEVAAEERKKPFNLRNILKGYFTQSTTKEGAVGANPLVTVKDFLKGLGTLTQVSDWLNDRRKPTQKQLDQVEHFKKFHAEFAKSLNLVFNTQVAAKYVSNMENLVGYMEMGKKASTRELDKNVVTALALSAYSYLIKQGNKVMNTNEELETLFRFKKGMRAPLHIEQMFRFAGQEMPVVVKALGTDAAKALGLKVREDQDPTLQDRLNTSLGILAMEAMAKAGFIVIDTLEGKPLTDFLTAIKTVRESKAHTSEDEYDFEVDTDAETEISKFTMVRPNALMEGESKTVFDGNRPVLTEGLPTLNSPLVNELIEANKDTKGFLSYLFGVDVGLTTPLKEIPKKFSQKLINGTDASVPSVQAELLTEAQKHSFTMRTNTVAVFAAMQKLGENSQFLKEVLGIWIDDHVLSRTHVTERDSLQAKAQNDWTAVLNGLEWADATLDENGQYTQFYDTQFVAQNQRQHLNSNMFSAQSSQIHRAMAALTGFSTTIDLTKDEALLNLFYQAVGEGLEGLDDYLKADILAKAEAGLHQFFTVDKVYGDYYVPALKAFLETDASKNAIEAMRALIETGTINTDQQKDIAAFVNKGKMGAQSLQSLIALAELDIAQDSKEQIFTTTIGFGSDGVNHGVSAANMLTGVISKDMRQQTGIFPIAEKEEDQIDNMQEVYKRKITDYYVDFGKVMSRKLRDLVGTLVGKLNTDFVQGMTALFPKFEVLDDTGELRNLLDMRKIAKIWAIPFNYSAGKAALQRALARGFLAGIYGEMNKLANKALDIIDAQKEDGITAEELGALDLKLATVQKQTDTLQHNLNKVLSKYGMSVTLPAPQLLNEEAQGKLSNELENTLMQAAIDLHGEAAWQATEEFAKEYLEVRNVYTEVEKASFTLFDVVRSQLIEEKKANRKFTNTAAKVQVKGKTVQYTAEELNAQEAEYFGLTTVEIAEVDAALAAMRPMFNTALSIGSESTNDAGSTTNPSGVSVRKHKMQREPASGLRSVSTFYGTPRATARNIGLTKEVEENAGVASSANAVQSIDAFVAAKVQGFMDALNVHDAAIFGLKNFLKGVKKQNEEHLKALTNYQLGLEHAKMLVKVYQGYKAFMATQELALKSKDATIKENAQKLITEANKQIRTLLRGEQMFKRGKPLLDQDRNLMFKGGLIPKLQAANLDIGNDAKIEEAISVFINFALAHDLQKLEVLLDTYSIHQFAGEGGMHKLTKADKESIEKQKALVQKALSDLGTELTDKAAPMNTTEAVKPITELVKFLRKAKGAVIDITSLIEHLTNNTDINDLKARAAQLEVLKAITPLIDKATKVVYSEGDYDGYGYYDETTNTLHINSAKEAEGGVRSTLAVHELLHAALSRRIKTLRTAIKNNSGEHPEAVAALKRLDALRVSLVTPAGMKMLELKAELGIEDFVQFYTDQDALIASLKEQVATSLGELQQFNKDKAKPDVLAAKAKEWNSLKTELANAQATLAKADQYLKLRKLLKAKVLSQHTRKDGSISKFTQLDLVNQLENTDEFISNGLTDSRLQRAMGNVQVAREGRTISLKFRKFVEYVGQILGFRTKEISALAAFASDTAALLETIGSVAPVVAPNNGERLFSTQSAEDRVNTKPEINTALEQARKAVRELLTQLNFKFVGSPDVNLSDIERIASKYLTEGESNNDPAFLKDAAISLSYAIYFELGLPQGNAKMREWLEQSLLDWLTTGEIPKPHKSVWVKAVEIFNKLMAAFSGKEFKAIESRLEATLNKIINREDFSFKPKQGYAKLVFQKEMTNNPLAVQSLLTFIKSGIKFALTGSVAYADQVPLYRQENKPLHDMDFLVAPEDLQDAYDYFTQKDPDNWGDAFTLYDVVKEGKRILGFAVVPKGFVIKNGKSEWNREQKAPERSYDVFNVVTGLKAGSYYFLGGKEEVFTGVAGITIDLLAEDASDTVTQTFKDTTGTNKSIEVSSYVGGFTAKLDMLRLKDITDFIGVVPPTERVLSKPKAVKPTEEPITKPAPAVNTIAQYQAEAAALEDDALDVALSGLLDKQRKGDKSPLLKMKFKAYNDEMNKRGAAVSNKGERRYSKNILSGNGLTVASTRQILVKQFGEKLVQALEAKGLLRIVETMKGIPEAALRSIKAYHGSPANFDKFMTKFINSGEGAQAFGWGHYFAGRKALGEWYRERLSNDNVRVKEVFKKDGKTVEFEEIFNLGRWQMVEGYLLAAIRSHNKGEDAVGLLDAKIQRLEAENLTGFTRRKLDEQKDVKALLLRYLAGEFQLERTSSAYKGTGQLYELNIDANDENFLDWYSVINDLPAEQIVVLQDIAGQVEDSTSMLGTFDTFTVGELYNELVETGHVESAKELSQYLMDAGIAGIRFLDQESRKNPQDEQYYNYVVFDENLITIENRHYSKDSDNTEGYYYNGQATLIADNLTPETVVATLLHELSGHKGFQELMEPAAYNALMKQFDKLVAEGNPIALAALKRAQEATGSDGKPLSLQGQMDEYLPYLLTIQAAINATQAQKSAIAKFIDNVFRAVRAWAYKKLQANGYEDAASAFMQPQDIVYMAERMLREIANSSVTSGNPQSSIKFSTQSAEDLVNGQSSLDIMTALPHSNTGAFNQQLDRLIVEEIGQLYNQDDAAKARIDEIQTFTASDALNAGFTLSRKEQYVQQALQYAVAAYMKLHAGGANVGQLRRIYHAAKAKMDITGKDFHEGDWSTATQQEQDLAKAKYDFLFDSTKEDYMSRFVSMALASESVSKILDIALPLTKPETQDKTWFETVSDWVSYVMAWLTNKYVRLNPVAGASNQLVQLMDNLVKLDIRNRQEGVALHQKAWNTIGLVTTPLNNALKGAGGALLSGVGLRDSRFLPVRALGAILVLRSEEAAKAIPKMIIDMRNNQLPNTKLGEVANILLEASGVGTLRDKFDVLIRQTNLNAKNRQDIVDNVKKTVNTWFKTSLTKAQHAAIAYGLLGTDAQALLENYSVEDIVNMVLHEGKLNVEIAKLKKEIAKNPNGNDMLNAAEQLGYYMVTRIGGEGLVKNALGISIGLGTQYFTSVEQADPKLVSQLNTLASMLAMTHVPNSDKAILAALYKTDAEGVHAVIQLHQGLVNDSLKDFQANPLNMVKGWMPEVTNPYLEIKAANSMVERQQMEAEGWVLIDELKRDKHDKGSPKYLMKHNDIGYQRLVSGAVDLGSTARSGTEAINRTSPKYLGITQARYQNAARRAAIPNGSFDPSKQPRGLIAAYDTDGVALGYNYEMDNETRDAHLDRKHNIGDLLGTFGGLNYYKPEKAKQSNKVAEVLFEDYKANYSQNPNAYLKISHKSTDPKVVEMWRMLPQDFKQRATELYGKGNPIIIRNEAFNLAFGFKKFSVVSYAFDAVNAERERIKNGLVGTGKSPNVFQSGFVRLAEATRGNTAQADFAKAEHVTQEIVKAIKDFIVIRSGTTMMWNIFANVLMLMANGINPVTIIKDWVFAVTNIRAYQKLNSQLIQAQADLAGGKDPVALKQRIGALKAELKANVMNPYINAGLLSSIVEDVNIQQGEYTYTSAFKQTVDEKTQWIPKPVKTAAKVLTIAPSTKLYQFLATTTQLSDFVAKYSMSKHLQASGTDIDASIIEASKTFINYDVPTSQGLQYANDMGLFMFTKFFLRIQAVLMKLLGKRAGSVIAQHLLVENLTGAEGVLSPIAYGRIGNNPLESSVFGLPSAFFSIGTVDAVTDVGAPF